ncbi:hypothetical protein GCM10018966_047270 [Streptomyces yanii]
MWITINEPAEVTMLGYALGEHAPGRTLLFDALPAAHHQLLAHGLGVRALRAAGATNIGIAVSHTPVWTAGESEEDRLGAELYDTITNWMFADPILAGRYPDENVAALMPGSVEDDLRTISTPLDWYGVNYYNPTLVGAPRAEALDTFSGFEMPAELPFGIREIEGYETTDFGWPVVPDGLRETLVQLRDRYGDRLPPLYITENGCAVDEAVTDTRRIAFIEGHLGALHTAIGQGVDVRGYFTWSLTDNIEWIEGTSKRFGLVHIDYETLRRTPKRSYAWYRDVIRSQKAAGTADSAD